MAKAVVDMTGQKFGRLTVLELAGRNNGAVWRVRCECGTEKTVLRCNLVSHSTVSCGCARREAKRHGHSRGDGNSPTYRSWAAMLNRVTNPKYAKWHRYGGRGITVCDRWRSFECFLEDMGQRPPRTSIDRVNNEGNYEPGNCRWATVAQQSANKTRGNKWTRKTN